MKTETEAAMKADRNILRIDDICVNFGGIRAVKNVSINVERGKIIALIGPNGAGKTTVFNAITGYNMLAAGKIYFSGQDITGQKTFKIAKLGISRTFQNLRLFSHLSVLENVKIGCHRNTKANFPASIIKLASAVAEEKQVKEDSFEALRIIGLAHCAPQKAYNLSYGDKRKLEIARALALKPELILLDEPAAGMNELETSELMEIIKKIRDLGITVFLVEHDMKFVMGISDKIFVLNHGELIAEGAPEEIRKTKSVIEAYLGKE